MDTTDTPQADQETSQEAQEATQEDPMAQVRALAQQDEAEALQEAMKEATVRVLQDRVVLLNVEVRIRDGRIAELEKALAERQNADAAAKAPDDADGE